MVSRLRQIASTLRRPQEGQASSSFSHLIIGLGNPGRQYARNRHNVGFQSVDHLAHLYGIDVKKSRSKALVGDGKIAGYRVLLVKPLTFMNESGQAVAALSRYYKVPAEHLIVVYDDIDLALGKIRVRPGGSSGGHNGIKSLIQHLGQDDFIRIRIGVGRPLQGDPVDYVLNDFDRDQEPVIMRAYERVDEIVRCLLSEGVQQTMNIYNGRQLESASDA